MALPNEQHSVSQTSNANFVPLILSDPHFVSGLQLAQHICSFPYEKSWIQLSWGWQNFHLIDTMFPSKRCTQDAVMWKNKSEPRRKNKRHNVHQPIDVRLPVFQKAVNIDYFSSTSNENDTSEKLLHAFFRVRGGDQNRLRYGCVNRCWYISIFDLFRAHR